MPDHQEVYLDKDGYTSIIFDITERVGVAGRGPATDGAALTTHLEDIVDSDTDTIQVWKTSETAFSKLPYVSQPPSSHLISLSHSKTNIITCLLSNTRTHASSREDTPIYTLIATQTPPAHPDSKDLAPDFTAIVLNLIRLESEHTDILITINVPHIKGEYDEQDVDLEVGKQGKLIEDAVDYASVIWETFKIKDWGLFKEV